MGVRVPPSPSRSLFTLQRKRSVFAASRRHEACRPAAPDNCFVDWAPFQSNHLVSAEKKNKKKSQSVCGWSAAVRAAGRVAHVPDLEMGALRGLYTQLLPCHLSVFYTLQWKACRLYKTGKDNLGFKQTFI